jgi:hypothetical protein
MKPIVILVAIHLAGRAFAGDPRLDSEAAVLGRSAIQAGNQDVHVGSFLMLLARNLGLEDVHFEMQRESQEAYGLMFY